MADQAPDVKEVVEKLSKDVATFIETNDQRLKQIEDKGSADVVTTEKLERIEKGLDALETINQQITKAAEDVKTQAENVAEQAEQLDRIETSLKRVDKAAGPDLETQEKKAAFFNYCRRGKEAMTAEEIKVLTVGDDATGGYLAPSEYVREIIKDVVEMSPIRTIARVRSTTQRSVMHPKRTGTFAAVWVHEAGTRSETTGLTYGLEEIPTHEHYALVDISEQDLEDSAFNLEAELNMEFAEQFGVSEGTAFVNGDAVGQPEGFLQNGDVGTTNSGHATLIQADGLIDTFHAIKSAYARNAVWVLNRNSIGAVRKLKDGNGQYLWMAGIANGVPNTIIGAPYVEATDMPNQAAAANSVAFGDFRRGYLIVDRIRLSVLRDPYTQAASGNVRFIARRRVGGQVVLAEALRLNTISA